MRVNHGQSIRCHSRVGSAAFEEQHGNRVTRLVLRTRPGHPHRHWTDT